MFVELTFFEFCHLPSYGFYLTIFFVDGDNRSLGCTIIEMLTGKPPYIDLIPMTALFRIVEGEDIFFWLGGPRLDRTMFDRWNIPFSLLLDDSPPLPDGISGVCVGLSFSCIGGKAPMEQWRKRRKKLT